MRTRWAAIGAAVAVTLGGGVVLVANAAPTASAERYHAIAPCRLLDTRTGTDNRGMWMGKIGPTSPVLSANQLEKNDLAVIFDPGAVSETTSVSGSSKALQGDCAPLMTASGEILTTHEPVAVALNVTVLNSSTAGFITIYPWVVQQGDYTLDKARRPFISQLNPIASHGPITNHVVVALKDTDNTVRIPAASCNISASDYCDGYKAFRIYSDQGLTDIFVDVVGYYTAT